MDDTNEYTALLERVLATSSTPFRISIELHTSFYVSLL